MRSGGTLNTTTSSSPSSPSTLGKVPNSPWHSPVPYLFGGLAAMLGLIAFALLILACSYWKLSGNMDNDGDERDPENPDEKSEANKASHHVYEEKIVVIMAGNDKPTYLATPISSRASSFGNSSTTGSTSRSTSSKSDEESEQLDKSEKEGQERNEEDEEQTENRANETRANENRANQSTQSQETPHD